jgi:hypothetical protein
MRISPLIGALPVLGTARHIAFTTTTLLTPPLRCQCARWMASAGTEPPTPPVANALEFLRIVGRLKV